MAWRLAGVTTGAPDCSCCWNLGSGVGAVVRLLLWGGTSLEESVVVEAEVVSESGCGRREGSGAVEEFTRRVRIREGKLEEEMINWR